MRDADEPDGVAGAAACVLGPGLKTERLPPLTPPLHFWSLPTPKTAADAVFHSIEYSSSLFIHMSPMLVTWTMRWNGNAGSPDILGTATTSPPRRPST